MATTQFTFGIIATLVTEYSYTEDGRFENQVKKFMIGASTEKGYQFVLAHDPCETAADAEKALAALNHNPQTNPDQWMSDYPLVRFMVLRLGIAKLNTNLLALKLIATANNVQCGSNG